MLIPGAEEASCMARRKTLRIATFNVNGIGTLAAAVGLAAGNRRMWLPCRN